MCFIPIFKTSKANGVMKIVKYLVKDLRKK